MSKQIILCAAMLILPACNDPGSEKCLDCQGGDMTDEPIRDLPCGGADLQNDNLNCGECGNECYVDQGDPRYQAGGCNEGKCGPRWFAKYLPSVGWDLVLPPEMTCDEVCAEYESTCVAQGCVGLTAYTCASSWGDGCSPYEPWGLKDFAGECSEKVPWPAFVDSGYELEVDCCCAIRDEWR